MAFNTAITGLKASTIELDVTGNNIANTSTVGFKSGRTEFADIFTTVVVGAGSTNNPGAGVIVSDIAQDFTAGTIEFTNNNLDLAIDGSGFFQLNDGQGGITYTRAGGFELDKDGNVISKTGKFLQGYGLDDAGNQLPIGNLAVDQKESAPQATSEVDLSFNVDSRADATDLIRPYDPDNSATFTFSTTTRTFDSLGNEHTLKIDMVEQPPVRERQTISFDEGVGFADEDSDGSIDDANGEIITIAGVDLTLNSSVTSAADLVNEIVNGSQGTDPNITLLKTADPRIDDISIDGNGDLQITYLASATDVEEVVIDIPSTSTALSANIDSVDIASDPDLPANEVQAIGIAQPTADGTITFGSGNDSVSIEVANGETTTQVLQRIINNQSQILTTFPQMDSLEADLSSTPPRLLINYKPEEGDVSTLTISENSTGTFTVSNFPNTGDPSVTQTETAEIEKGDDSYIGVYQMYAYLNGEDLLDIGKETPPGEPADTEPGPVLVTFDRTNGTLQSVNGIPVSGGGLATPLTIDGADPADPDNEIELDLTGTTQFASESIVKAATQDGFTKGDLIGVAFAEDGTMVASFSNGQNTSLGVVALATFENQGGLQPTGDTEWSATLDSGQAILNPPGTGLNGALRSSALEQSNVDLSEELVALIEAQRNFQANSKTLETENAVTQTILQIS